MNGPCLLLPVCPSRAEQTWQSGDEIDWSERALLDLEFQTQARYYSD